MDASASSDRRAAVVAEATWFVYALTDPGTHEVRYVGYTSKTVRERLAGHLASSRSHGRNYDIPIYRWIRALAARGERPGVIVLEAGNGDWREREREHIARQRAAQGRRLLNVSAGGEGADVPPESRERARQKLRLRVFSSDHRARISQAKRGRPRPDMRGNDFGRANYGKKMATLTERGREARRESMKRLRASPDWRTSATPQELEAWRKRVREGMRRVWAQRSPDARAKIMRAVNAHRRRVTPEEARTKKTTAQRRRRARARGLPMVALE